MAGVPQENKKRLRHHHRYSIFMAMLDTVPLPSASMVSMVSPILTPGVSFNSELDHLIFCLQCVLQRYSRDVCGVDSNGVYEL